MLSLCLSWELCLFRQVQAFNDTSLLYHELFSLYLHISVFMLLIFIQSIIVSLCLPRVLVSSILPSKTVCKRDSLLNTWPNQFFHLCRMVFIKLLYSSTMFKTSWLDWCSVQLIFINLLLIHILNNSSHWLSTFLNVHVSAAYNTVCQIRVFTILLFLTPTSSFLSFFPIDLWISCPRLLNASFPMAIQHFTSSWHLQSSVITLPKYINCLDISDM